MRVAICPPKWLNRPVAAASGRDAGDTIATNTLTTMAHKGILEVQRHGDVVLPVAVPDLGDAVAGLFVPDKPRAEPSASFVRMPRAVAKLVVLFPHLECYPLLLQMVVKLFHTEGLNHRPTIFLYWAKSSLTASEVPDYPVLHEVVGLARRLFGPLHVDVDMSIELDPAAAIVIGGILALWAADADCEEAAKEVAHCNVQFALHGLWYGAQHESDTHPVVDSDLDAMHAIVPQYLREVSATRFAHQYSVHARAGQSTMLGLSWLRLCNATSHGVSVICGCATSMTGLTDRKRLASLVVLGRSISRAYMKATVFMAV